MKVKILDSSNAEKGQRQLPKHFDEDYRPDLITRAVLSIRANSRQRYGSAPEAGKRSSVTVSKRRRNYRGCYGHGISRVPRKVMSRRGIRFNWVGAFAPGTVGGRRAHPPKAEKIWDQKINIKERRKAIRSAIAATLNKEIVSARGHKIPTNYPFIISNDFELIANTKLLKNALLSLGFSDEFDRASEKRVRAGRGKSRGRRYNKKKSILFVVSESCALQNAAKNLPGVDIQVIDKLNANLLAPGCHAGRIALYTEKAIERLDKENLFYDKK